MLRSLCLSLPLVTALSPVQAQMETLLRGEAWAVAQWADDDGTSASCLLISQPPASRSVMVHLFITDRVPGFEVFVMSETGTPANGPTTLALAIDDEDDPWLIPG